MAKTAKRGEMPDVETYYGIPPQKVGHDFEPTEKNLETERTVENAESHPGIIFKGMDKDAGDIAPKRIADVMKELAVYTKKEVGQEKPSMPIYCFDKRYGRRVSNEMFAKDNRDDVEFIIRDAQTGEVLASKNIKFMDELNKISPEYAELLEQILREGYPGEKSH